MQISTGLVAQYTQFVAFRSAIRLGRAALVAVLSCLLSLPAFAWGDKGHRIVNRAAWQRLPAEMPAFLRADHVGAQLEYLGPEPDRWRSSMEEELAAAQGPEHYINFETADLLGELPRQRWEFVQRVYAYRAAHPEQVEMLPERIGLLPWEMTEVEERLQAAFREWRLARAEHRDTAPVEASIIFYMGWLGHYVADGSQPLHTSVQFNGWSGPNPYRYTTEHGIHAQFETEFVNKNIGDDDVRRFVHPATPMGDVFTGSLAYLRDSNRSVEPVYQLEKAGELSGEGSAASRRFVAERLGAAVTMLDSMWLTAWRNSANPVPERMLPANPAPK